MTSDGKNLSPDLQARLDQAIAEYLEAANRGHPIDRNALLRLPRLGRQLGVFF
jgi:hypothetical protein